MDSAFWKYRKAFLRKTTRTVLLLEKHSLGLFLCLGITMAFLWFITSCVSLGKPKVDKLVWSTPRQKEDIWERYPSIVNGNILFVGISSKCDNEKEARDDARRDALRNLIEYIKPDPIIINCLCLPDSSPERRVLEEIAPDIVRQFTESIVRLVSRSAKDEAYYVEKWQTQTKEPNFYYIVYVLVRVPEQALVDVFAMMKEEILKILESKADEVTGSETRKIIEKLIARIQEVKDKAFLDIFRW